MHENALFTRSSSTLSRFADVAGGRCFWSLPPLKGTGAGAGAGGNINLFEARFVNAWICLASDLKIESIGTFSNASETKDNAPQ
jgi:hypothetical protein